MSGDESAATAQLAPDYQNIREASLCALAAREPDHVGRIVEALFPFLITQGHVAEARGWVETALADREHLSHRGLVATLIGGGEIARFGGDLDRAIELKEEELALVQDDPELAGWTTGTLADLCDIALDQGDFERARRYGEESAAAGGGPRAAISLAELALREGRLSVAESYALVALEGFDDGEFNHACVLETMGEIARRLGNTTGARIHFNDGLRSFAAIGDGGGVADCLEGLSRLAVDAGDLERAGRLSGAAHQLRETWGRRPTRTDAPPVEASSAARDRGAAMSLDEAVAYALSSID